MRAVRRSLSLFLCLLLTALSGREVLAQSMALGAQAKGSGIKLSPGTAGVNSLPKGIGTTQAFSGTSFSLTPALPGSKLPGPQSAPLVIPNAAASPVAPLVEEVGPASRSLSGPKAEASPGIIPTPGKTPAGIEGLSIPAAVGRGDTGRLGEKTAPVFDAVQQSKTSPDGVHFAGAELQDIITRSGSRKSPTLSLSPQKPDEGADRQGPAAFGLRQCCGEDHDIGPVEGGGKSDVPPPKITEAQKRNFDRYKFGISAVKIGIETLNLVVPVLLLAQFGAATLVGALFISADLGGLLAGWLSGSWIDRIRPSRVLAGSAIIQTVVIGAIPLSLALGFTLPLWAFFGLFTINGVFSGVFDIARRAQMPQLVGRDEGVLREYNGRLYIWREIAAIGGVLGAGWLASKIGYLPALWMHPAFYIFAAYLFSRVALSKGLSAVAKQSSLGAQMAGEAEKKSGGKSIKTLFAGFFRGAKIVWKDPKMRMAALVNLPLSILHKLFHALLAVVYAAQVLENPLMAAWILGAWNAGELAGAWYLKSQGRKESSFGWLKFASVASLSAWGLWLIPSVWAAAPIAFLLAAAMINGEIGLAAFFQSTAKKEDVGSVAGFVYSAAAAVSMLSLVAIGGAIDAFGIQTGLLGLAVFMTLTAGFFALAKGFFNKRPPEGPSPKRGAYFRPETSRLNDPPLSE